MSTSFEFGGELQTIPSVGETGYGPELIQFWEAIPQFTFQNPADFSNSTLTLRQVLQTITSNSPTYLTVAPNGTSTASALQLYSDSALANASTFFFGTDGTTQNYISSGTIGTGTLLPINFVMNGTTALSISTSGVTTVSSLNVTGAIIGGTWQGNVIAGQYGGTGVANTGKTITLGGNLTTSGAYASTFTMTGATSVTFPTSGTLATTAATLSSWSGDSTGLTPSTPTTGAVVLAGTLNIAHGGTGQTTQTAAFDALSPLTTTGDIIYYNGTHNVRLPAGINGQALELVGGVPAWATLTGTGTVTSVSGTTNQIVTTNPSTAVVVSLASNIILPNPGSGANLTINSINGATGLVINTGNGSTANGLSIIGTYTGAGTADLVLLQDNGNTNGVNIKMVGNGGTTPSKTLRVVIGQFQIINDAYTQTILTVDDSGNLFMADNITAGGAITSSSDLTLSGTIYGVNNIFGQTTSSAYTIAANPLGSFTSGGYIQLYGSTASPAAQITINAAGNTLAVFKASGVVNEQINQVTGSARGLSVVAAGGQAASLSVCGNGNTPGTNDVILYQDASSIGYVGNDANADFYIQTNQANRIHVTADGAVTVLTPVSGTALTLNATTSLPALTVNGANSSYAQYLYGGSGAANSFGLNIQAGTTSADGPLLIQNQSQTKTLLQVDGVGDIYGLGVALTKYVQAQETRTSTFTLAPSTYLTFSGVPAGTYRVTGMVQFQGITTGTQGASWQINFSTSGSGPVNMAVQGVVNNSAYPPVLFTGRNATVNFSTIDTSTSNDFTQFDVTYTLTSTTTVAFYWAQRSSSANSTVLAANGVMTLMRVG